MMRKLSALAFASVLFFGLLAGYSTLSAAAIDPSQTVTISRSTVCSMLNAGGLTGYYHAVGDVLTPFSFSYRSDSEDVYFPDSYNGDSGLHHFATYRSDISGFNPNVSAGVGMVGQVPINFHFHDVSYISFYVSIGITTSAYIYDQVSLSNAQQYLTLCIGETAADIMPIGSRTESGGYSNLPARCYYGWYQSDWAKSGCALFRVTIERSQASELYIGDLNFGYISPLNSSLGITHIDFSISDIIINSGYTFAGRDEPPAYTPDAPVDWGSGTSRSSGTISGTITDGSGTQQNINVTVETENDNTGLIAGILNGIKNLFIPTDTQLTAFTDDMQDIAENHLGALYQAVDIIHDAFSGIDDISALNSIHVDTVTIPLLNNQSFSFGNWDIPLKPSTTGGFATLYTAIAVLIDFLAAAAFLNMCHTKLEVILNPESEVVTSDN